GRELLGNDRYSRGFPRVAEPALRHAETYTRHAPELERRYREISLPPRRWRIHRDSGDSRRFAPHPLYLVAGRVRAPVRLLRDRRDGIHAQSSVVRDRRSGA